MKKAVVLGVVVTSVLAATSAGAGSASASARPATAGSSASAPVAAQSLESQAVTNAAVANLRSELGLSESEARRRYAAQSGLDAVGAKLLTQLGDQQAGAWFDPADGQLVVNVLNDEGARVVHAAGARARVVRHSDAELRRIVTELGNEPVAPGSSWGIDPRVDAVVVDVPIGQSFTPVRDYGDSVITRQAYASAVEARAARDDVDAATTTAKPDLYGGLSIRMKEADGDFRCTSGFLAAPTHPAPDDRFQYLLTAGHCGDLNTHVFRGNSEIGVVSHREYGPHDHETIVLTKTDIWQPQPWVYTRFGPQPVHGGYTSSAAGSTVCVRGAVNNYNCGTVNRFDVTTVSSDGVHVIGLVSANLCTTHGDSGAPVMVANGRGVLGVGLVSSGPETSGGECQGVTDYEPLQTALGDSLKLVTGQ